MVEIVTFGMPAAPSEWQAAMLLPEAELPEMSADEFADVSRLGLDILRHRRGLAIRRIAKMREERQALELATYLQQLAGEARLDIHVARVMRTSLPVGWSVRLTRRDPIEVADVLIAQPTVDALTGNTASPQEIAIFLQQLGSQFRPAAKARKAS